MTRRAPCSAHVAALRALFLMSTTLLLACEKAPEPPLAARPVLTTTIKPVTTEVFGPFSGAIEPRHQSSLAFQTGGRMVVRDVSVGNVVRKGDRLALLDQAILRFELQEARSSVVDAQAQLANTQAVEGRQRTLRTTGVVAQTTVDASVANKDTASARLHQADAALRMAEDRLGYAELRADFDGVITAWTSEVGQVVAQGTAVVTLARLDVREAVVDIPAELIDKVRIEHAFKVALQAAQGVTVIGHAREIAPSAERETRTRRVRFALDDPPQSFRIGSTVVVTFTAAVAPRMDIPSTAVLERDGRSSVWTIGPEGSSVHSRDVSVMARAGGMVTVTGELREGDRVVVAGINRLKEGQAVRVSTSFP